MMKHILTSLNRFQQKFYTSKVSYLAAEQTLSIRASKPACLIDRKDCLFRYHDFTSLALEHREKALQAMLAQWCPFADFQYQAYWYGSAVSVWFWQRQSDADIPKCQYHTESLYLPRAEDGVVAQQCRQGWDLQFWECGRLQASTWFCDKPTNEQQARFKSECQLSAIDKDVCEVIYDASLMTPWAAELNFSNWWQDSEVWVVCVVFSVISAVFVFQEVRYWKIETQSYLAESEQQQLQQELSPVLMAKNQYQQLFNENKRMSQLFHRLAPHELVLAVDETMNDMVAPYKEWDLNEDRLHIVLNDEDGDPIRYVSLLQKRSEFSDVRAAAGRKQNEIVLDMAVVR